MGFAHGLIGETERLCLMCPGCRRLTDVVNALQGTAEEADVSRYQSPTAWTCNQVVYRTAGEVLVSWRGPGDNLKRQA